MRQLASMTLIIANCKMRRCLSPGSVARMMYRAHTGKLHSYWVSMCCNWYDKEMALLLMVGELVLDLLSCTKDHSMLCVKYFLRDLEALEKENQVQAGKIRPLKEGRTLENWATIWLFS